MKNTVLYTLNLLLLTMGHNVENTYVVIKHTVPIFIVILISKDTDYKEQLAVNKIYNEI
jgi:hypothetical protein